jgi:hypothetical protein
LKQQAKIPAFHKSYRTFLFFPCTVPLRVQK